MKVKPLLIPTLAYTVPLTIIAVLGLTNGAINSNDIIGVLLLLICIYWVLETIFWRCVKLQEEKLTVQIYFPIRKSIDISEIIQVQELPLYTILSNLGKKYVITGKSGKVIYINKNLFDSALLDSLVETIKSKISKN